MSKYLIDHTGDYLQEAARQCSVLAAGDMRLEVLARESLVVIRGCMGGILKTWDEEGEIWEVVATAKVNPLLPIIERVMFRLQRQADRLVPPAENRQKGNHAGQEERGISGN